MRSFLVTYRLSNLLADPDPLLDCLKAYSSSWHGGDALWMIATESSPMEVRDELWTAMGEKGQLFVVDVTGQSWAHAGISEDGTTWLKEHVR